MDTRVKPAYDDVFGVTHCASKYYATFVFAS